MAKLNKKAQEAAKTAAASSGFDPMPDGVYHGKLRDVDTTRSGGKGPYWSWEFEIIDDVTFVGQDGKTERSAKGRRLWNNTSLSEAAAFKMDETFAAFGAPLDTDTDDLIGKVVKLQVSQRTIQEGARKGELTNQVDRLKPADDAVIAQADKELADQKGMAEIF